MTARAQIGLSLLMLAALCGAFALVAMIARATPVFANHVAHEVERLERYNGAYYYDEAYTEEGDYVLLGQLLEADYSQGGVYLIGTSEFNAAFMPWALSAAERRYVHNYSIGDMRHCEVGHFIRMLVEENGLLEAGGERTTVVLALTFQLTRRHGGERYVHDLFGRHGLYSYDLEAGIHRLEMPAWRRALIVERDRANRFLRISILSPSRVRTDEDSDEFKLTHMRGVMAGDWQGAMREEVGHLAEQIDYLQRLGVTVVGVFPPSGTWQDTLPYEAAYHEMVEPVLAARGVETVDLRDLVADEHFIDAIHTRYSGRVQTHRALMQVVRRALDRMGVSLAERPAARAAR